MFPTSSSASSTTNGTLCDDTMQNLKMLNYNSNSTTLGYGLNSEEEFYALDENGVITKIDKETYRGQRKSENVQEKTTEDISVQQPSTSTTKDPVMASTLS